MQWQEQVATSRIIQANECSQNIVHFIIQTYTVGIKHMYESRAVVSINLDIGLKSGQRRGKESNILVSFSSC